MAPRLKALPMPSNTKSSPTSSEVARRAGVSRTTVSFVLNNVLDQGISDTTRERVLATARELGYEPNAAARMLASGTTGTVGLVIPKASHLYVDAFLAQLVGSINEECHRHDLKLLIESAEDKGSETGGFVNLVRSRRIDGLIVINLRISEQEHLQRLRDAGIPFVLLASGVPDMEKYHTMGNDTGQSAQTAVKHLLGLGHRRIAYVSYAPRDYHSVIQREQGWRDALSAHGIDADPAWLEHADISAHSGYLATQRLIARSTKFTALFAGNDTIAFGAIKALTEAGLRIPNDVALVGYDDIPLAEFATPPLTTMRTDPIGHGRDAMRMLLAQLRDQTEAVALHTEREAELVIRASCGAQTHGAS
jgi:DNA-binding LacI/PurR family transcriptional regulator